MVERRVSEHEEFLSIVVAGATQIGVVEQWDGAAVLGGGVVGLSSEQRGDALAIEDAQFEGSGRDCLEPRRIEAAIAAQKCPGKCGTPVRDAGGWRARR